MRWRMIGPHRASRTKALAGIPEQPHAFYMGVVNGGVIWAWSTAGFGRPPMLDGRGCRCSTISRPGRSARSRGHRDAEWRRELEQLDNQPTAQFYHVTTDKSFPYRVCSGQQESGSVCISSRGDDGQITFREWHPVGVEEYGYVAPDPLDPDIVYGGKVSRYAGCRQGDACGSRGRGWPQIEAANDRQGSRPRGQASRTCVARARTRAAPVCSSDRAAKASTRADRRWPR
jgi:hypothetical protein